MPMPRLQFRALLVLLLALYCVSLGVHAQATLPASSVEGKRILSVQIVGNNRTSTQLIMDQIRSQPGQLYSQAIVDNDTRAISALDRFVTVVNTFTPDEDPATHAIRGVHLRFTVEERDVVAQVLVTGNRKFSTEQIREGLVVRPGSLIDDSRINTDKRYILDLYKKKGYAQISVDVDKSQLREGIVHYTIIEGPASQIRKIEIDGNSFLSDAYIKWRISTKTYFWIFRKGLLDEEKLQADVAAIRDMYRKKAFLDVRVSYVLEFSEDKSRLTVRFVVIEGMRYKIGNITLEGNTVFSRMELLGDTSKFGPGSWAQRDQIEALEKRIDDAYGHEGYIDSKITVDPGYTATPGVVDLKISITEGKPYTVGKIVVRGNSFVQDRVVRRQIRIYPDQTFDMVLVRKSLDRLKATGLFKDVQITPVSYPDDPPGVKTALVQVAEGQTGKLSFGAGISTNNGLVGQISLEQNNFDILNFPKSFDEFFRGQSFKGAGQYFRLLLEPGTEFQRYRLTFAEPYLFDTPYSFSNDIFYFTRGRESWNERRIGDIVTFGRRYGDVWSLATALRAEQVTISKPADFLNDGITQVNFPFINPNGSLGRANDTAQEILNEKGSHFLTSIKPSVARDTTDSAVFPTVGTRTVFSIEQYGALGGEITMTKFLLNFNWYKTVYTDLFDRKTVFSLRNEVGFVPFGDSPTYERFYLGGIGDLRGFRFRGVGPRSGPRKDPIGGDFEWVTTGELNYPIYEEFLRGVVFVDVGTVERDITISTIRSDFGAGVRLQLPFLGTQLPIALDFAYPLTKGNLDKTQFFSVSLGGSF
ncbi:MAG TPA: outer membrane protein assembly factor BamA [Phycisphaerae bacterium]|nr:outer membrane protein assembly factor BamA [Phycisphaerae bacterium]